MRCYSVEAMLERKTQRTDAGCWEWTGKLGNNGYGHAWLKTKFWLSHRLFYEHFKGAIPEGMQIDHLCGNRCCCNPAHLEAVTACENNRRSSSPSARNAVKTECLNGHPLSGNYLYLTPDGRRNCATCRRGAVARSHRKRRQPCHASR